MGQCPMCEQELTWQGDGYYCQSCQDHFNKVAFCPKCDQQVEKLKACGAVSYFCNHCNELQSKSKVRIEFQKKS
ncbi:zinc ribbon domain-containing protein [Vibrio sp. SS-MA-C1-2]|uniref:zinc ribbon domain-containing protein n=1 Tax=Vibrio sp. SS-MA-C1-2 TaxID=2908646 RepID=UPI001F16A338|nr:zinc ribbon domain-containing protein [Vibrio sp. SS-MA-C1-2]UJF18952.1 zinc ribbon domain-containing protein [Vibrio sp. SS-MA-C1-2]